MSGQTDTKKQRAAFRIFAPVKTGHRTHPAFCTIGTGSLSRE